MQFRFGEKISFQYFKKRQKMIKNRLNGTTRSRVAAVRPPRRTPRTRIHAPAASLLAADCLAWPRTCTCACACTWTGPTYLDLTSSLQGDHSRWRGNTTLRSHNCLARAPCSLSWLSWRRLPLATRRNRLAATKVRTPCRTEEVAFQTWTLLPHPPPHPKPTVARS